MKEVRNENFIGLVSSFSAPIKTLLLSFMALRTLYSLIAPSSDALEGILINFP